MLVTVAKGCRWFAAAAAVTLLLTAGAGPAFSQRLGEKATVEEPYRKLEGNVQKYLTGEKVASGPMDKEAVAAATAAAKWYVYRLTWFEIQGALDREYLSKIVRDFDRNFMGYAVEYGSKGGGKNKTFMEIFDKQMIGALKELLARNFAKEVAVHINAAVMLPMLARYGDENVGDYLVEVLKDPKLHDAIKVHALKGLKEFFVHRPVRVDPDTEDEKVRQRDAARVEAVLAFLNRKLPAASPDEVEAQRFIRREAIKALAETRVSATYVRKTTLQVPVALGLMRVLAAEANGLAPAPSLAEESEAAIGLCRIKGSVFDQYHPDATVFLVGKFLVAFAKEYKDDYAAGSLPGKAKGVKDARDARPALLPWKFHAVRLEKALTELQAAVPTQASKGYRENLKVLVEHALPLLAKMRSYQDLVGSDQLLENALARMWPMNPPAAVNVFQGVPNAQIQVPALKESP